MTRRYTLIEIVVVLAIIALALSLMLPKTGRVPRRVVRRSTLSTVRVAFRDASLKARASATPVRLVLDAEKEAFRLDELPTQIEGAPVGTLTPRDDPGASDGPGFLSRLSEYPFDFDVDWHLEDLPADVGNQLAYAFFPDGEATGPTVEFTVVGTRYRLDVDRLTGRPLLAEVGD